jgi:serine/threonine protein kinase
MIKEADPDMSGDIWDKISDNCKDLLMKMLAKDPTKRISIDDAL